MALSDRKTTAADVMTASPRTCSTFSTVLEAALIFRDADCGAVPVLDDGKPVGVLTDRDVALGLIELGADLGTAAVSQLMTQGVVTVAPTDTVDSIAEKFADQKVRRLLVLDGDLLVGIIAWADLAGHLSPVQFGQVVSEIVEES